MNNSSVLLRKSVFNLESGLKNLPNKTKRITAGIILIYINDNGLEVGLVRNKWSKKWGFPKGGVERNESLKIAAERETLEETGLFIKINNETSYRINKTTYFIKLMDQKLKMNPKDKNEILDTKWCNIKDLPNNPENSTRDIRIFKELQKGSLKSYLEKIEKEKLFLFKSKNFIDNNKEYGDRWKNLYTVNS